MLKLERVEPALEPPEYTFDAVRRAALASYDILDTPEEPEFDGIVRLAIQICETPVALVSLVAEDRQWFKARIGFAPCETDLSSSVCAHALVEPDLLIIPDLTLDERSRDNPLVLEDPHIRFYGGAPLRMASGQVLGSLCVIDVKPRPAGLTPAQADGLRILAHQVTSLLEMRKAIVERDALTGKQREAETRRLALLHIGDRLRDASTPAEMTRIAASTVGELLQVSRVGFSQFDENGQYLAEEPDWTSAEAPQERKRCRIIDNIDLREGLMRGEPVVIGDVGADPRTIDNATALTDLCIRSVVNMPLRQRGRTVAVLVVHDRRPRDWSPEILIFLRNVTDRLEVGIARLKAEAEQHVLNDELSHRIKNTFAMIQAIASQTLQSVSDREAVDAFVRRLHALSTAHEVLLKQNWAAAEIDEVARNVVGAIADPQRVSLSGPNVVLGARATLSLSLLLHELTANAVKYGSLSNQTGRAAATWRVEGEDGKSELVLDWVESGGPPVTEPNRKGFGSKLIRMGLVGMGGVELRYAASGLTAQFRAPLAQAQET